MLRADLRRPAVRRAHADRHDQDARGGDAPLRYKRVPRRWYRPERAVVIISGDIDPAVFEALVDKNFSDWKGKGPTPADPDFGTPATKQPITAIAGRAGIPPLASMAVCGRGRFNRIW